MREEPDSLATGPARRAGDRVRLARMRQILDIDLHILQTLLLRGWSVIAGGMMVLFIPYWFDRVDQGYYYTFNSLLAIQIFFELGMNQVVVQLVSHEAAHVRQLGDGGLSGARAPIVRLASLLALLSRWYRVAALLFLILGGAAGAVFFAVQGLPSSRELIIWGILVLFTAVNLYLSPSLAILEGMGHVGDVARVRLTQSILGYVVMWIALSLGAGLAGAPVLAGAATIYSIYWLVRKDRRLGWLRRVDIATGEEVLNWRRDVFPFQWRIALSWISGFLILQLLVPMAFARQGAIEAGRLGLTLTVYNSLLAIGLSWVNARLPVMAGHLARKEEDDARRVLRGVAARSAGVTAIGALGIALVVAILPDFMRTRFSDGITIAALGLATVVNCLIYAMATFARAHKEEPLLLQSICSALIMVPAIYFGSHYSVAVMSTSFCAVVTLLSLPWVFTTFRRYYNRI